jgi:predicted dithiol-disulfide oxidoreductase (DUF899 family)
VSAPRPFESDEYTVAREKLRHAELELCEHVERVAALRRALPLGAILSDYDLLDSSLELATPDEVGRPVALSELVADGGRPLLVYHLMFGKQQVEPCPMCTMWIDGFNGIAPHVMQNADLVVVAAASPVALHAHARDRGWSSLRVLSAGDSAFKPDLSSEDADGNQIPMISVIARDDDGVVRHRYSVTPALSDEHPERGIDPMCATWSLLDLTPDGRGEWYASLDYPSRG